MADAAYRLKADASFPRPIREVETLVGGQTIWETVGVSYAAGDYILASNMTPRDAERAANGELDNLLEPASLEEAQAAAGAGSDYGVFIPQHEAEAVALESYGHEVVPRDQVLELNAAGAEAAAAAQADAKSGDGDARPGLTAPEVPSLVQAANEGTSVVPSDSTHVDDAKLAGVERPPGFPVGADLAAAEGGVTASATTGTTRKRSRPGTPPAEETPAA